MIREKDIRIISTITKADMGKDSKQAKHKYSTRSKKKQRAEEEKRKKKYDESSDDSSDSDWDSEGELDLNEEFDMKQYREFLASMFPSQYAFQRAADTPPSKRKRKSQSKNTSESDSEDTPKPSHKKKRRTKKHIVESESEADDDSAYVPEDGEENIVLESKEKYKKSNKKRKATADEEAIEQSEEEEDLEDYEEEDEVDELDEDAPPTNFTIHFNINGQNELMEEDGEIGEEEEDEDDDDDEDEDEDETTKNKDAIEKLRKLIADYATTCGEDEPEVVKKMKKELESTEKKIKKKEEKKKNKVKTKNAKKFAGLLREKNVMNDAKYFRDKLTVPEQEKVLRELDEVMKYCTVEKPYRLQLLDTDIPPAFKAVAMKKINALRFMEPGGGEYYKIKQWVDTFMQIPFGKYKSLPVTLQDDGAEACATFMDDAKSILDEAVYGMDDVKLQIMQMVGQWITNPGAMGNAIAIKGPMGTGKTTLVKEGISKVLGRDFAFMALGGATDSSFLEGHGYTYEGATWGKIIDCLVQANSMNPVFFFDELDKISDTPKGEEITGILTHLTDTTQNSKFHDKYFAELDFDLSKCLFIFSYNDENKVNPILRDRMYRVQTKGYETKEKTVIANQYLLPKIQKQVCFNNEDITIDDDVMKHIISTHTESEKGVRNLKRCLEIVYTKMNLYRLMRPGSNLFGKEMSLEVSFPMTITREVVDKLIKIQKDEGVWRSMYI